MKEVNDKNQKVNKTKQPKTESPAQMTGQGKKDLIQDSRLGAVRKPR